MISCAVAESGAEIEDFDGLCDRLEGLKKFLEKDQSERTFVELSILYAMQAVAVEHDVPKGLLETMFDAAYNANLVTLDSFCSWESSDNAEENGQGMCVTSVRSFLRDIRSKTPIA